MEHEVIALLVGLGLGFLRHYRQGAKVEKALKAGARVILDDAGNPITDPKQALVHALIAHNFDEIDRMAAELEEMQAQAKRDAADALARGRAMSQGMNITIVDPHDGSERKAE